MAGMVEPAAQPDFGHRKACGFEQAGCLCDAEAEEISVWRHASSGPEGAGELDGAKADEACELCQGSIVREVGVHVVHHPRDPPGR